MPRPISILLNHDLGKDEARRRIAEGFGKIKATLSGGVKLKFTEEWPTEDRFVFSARGFGQRIEGTIDIFPQHVRIDAILPGALAAIAEIIAGRIEKQGALLLEKK